MALLGMGCSYSQQNYQSLDVQGFSDCLNRGGVTLLDVRSAEEYAEGHIYGAVNIDVRNNVFMDEAKTRLDKSKTIAVYCRSGRRSAHAADLLSAEGYQVVNLKGGIEAWKESKGVVSKDVVEIDVFKTGDGETIEIYALMHACIRIVYKGKEIEIDPVRRLGNRIVDYTSLPNADFVFVTHEHKDHFDQDAISDLRTENTRLITNQRCGDLLGYGEIMKNGDKMVLSGDIQVEAVPAYNITEGHLQFHPKGRDNGFIITLGDIRIYIAGDTEDIPEMAGIKDIDIAFLPCNQPYTMTTDQLSKAARTIKPKVLFPYHYGNTDVSGVPEELKSDGIDVRIRHYE